MKPIRIASDSPWEKRYGYARAVRRGDFVAVSGTVACDAGGRAVGADAYAQTSAILGQIGVALSRAGGRLEDVVRLRVYHAGADVADGFTRALGEAFPEGAPALTSVRVAALVAEEFLLEIEAEAVLPGPSRRERADEHDEPVD